MTDILMGLAQYGGAVAVLIASIFYFLKKESKYEAQISKLQDELRTNEKETLKLIQSLTVTLDKVMAAETGTKTEVLNEIKVLKETIIGKIESLKNA